MRLKTVFAAAAVLLTAAFSAAQAAPITYTLKGSFSGSIGGVVVYNDPYTWTITADTNQVFHGPSYIGMPALTSTIVATGFVPLTTTEPFFALFSPLGEGAFTTAGFTQEIFFDGLSMKGYNGLGPYGPATVFFDPTLPISTSLGDWYIDTAASVPELTFQATGGVIPEPVTLTLFAVGLAGLGVLRRRKQKA